jgi:hypothetical protein
MNDHLGFFTHFLLLLFSDSFAQGIFLEQVFNEFPCLCQHFLSGCVIVVTESIKYQHDQASYSNDDQEILDDVSDNFESNHA